MTSSLIIKGILLQYGGFLVAMLAVAITVVSPRSEALFGISTTTCLLIGALLLLSLIFFVLSFFFRLYLIDWNSSLFVSKRRALTSSSSSFVQKPNKGEGKLTNQL